MFQKEANAFRKAKEQEAAEAKQCAAFFLMSGIDLGKALKARGEERAAILLRLGRLIERERMKGARRHWSYALNRHIALKQAYDRLRGNDANTRSRHASQPRRRQRISGNSGEAAPIRFRLSR